MLALLDTLLRGKDVAARREAAGCVAHITFAATAHAALLSPGAAAATAHAAAMGAPLPQPQAQPQAQRQRLASEQAEEQLLSRSEQQGQQPSPLTSPESSPPPFGGGGGGDGLSAATLSPLIEPLVALLDSGCATTQVICPPPTPPTPLLTPPSPTHLTLMVMYPPHTAHRACVRLATNGAGFRGDGAVQRGGAARVQGAHRAGQAALGAYTAIPRGAYAPPLTWHNVQRQVRIVQAGALQALLRAASSSPDVRSAPRHVHKIGPIWARRRRASSTAEAWVGLPWA